MFLSYASQDAEEARRICDALRQAGVEVWFDQSELRGGDAWDQNIRRQIRECALFVPLISGQTQARREGYFRREWKLAADRTQDMAEGTPFLLPVVVDGTREQAALVPESFLRVQWTWLPAAGEVPPAFVQQVSRLLGGQEPATVTAAPAAAAPRAGSTPPTSAAGAEPVRARAPGGTGPPDPALPGERPGPALPLGPRPGRGPPRPGPVGPHRDGRPGGGDGGLRPGHARPRGRAGPAPFRRRPAVPQHEFRPG